MTDCAKTIPISIQIGNCYPALKLFVLFGSRARGDHDPSSDWDVAFPTNPIPTKTTYDWVSGADLIPIMPQHLQTSDEKIDPINVILKPISVLSLENRDGKF